MKHENTRPGLATGFLDLNPVLAPNPFAPENKIKMKIKSKKGSE